ncbi:uncharacterized protein LOC112270117 [Brachypodium distachyon]|uniref:uncharacterized protein LOC112270117 n=1 Tax=Brachypodium distachyon TaxID=15368 RepID=UPI000D0E30CE|nr:uncharacterized protein LOC112270117 [Brachypodium distachyon]|eukprot:XP_024313594.1 uncharacterized protein LOC112270117 [Brachypodium distachyon]
MPCNHAISAIYKAKQHPEDYVDPFFKKYLQSYSAVIYPVPGQHDWTRTNAVDTDPPIFLKHPGRPKHKKRKGQFEPPAARDTSRMGVITCSNCKLEGHNYLSCKKALRPDLLITKNNHKANRAVPDYVEQPQSPSDESPRQAPATSTPPPRTSPRQAPTASAPPPRRSPRQAPSAEVAPPRRSPRKA